jgi:hypothetical protein
VLFFLLFVRGSAVRGDSFMLVLFGLGVTKHSPNQNNLCFERILLFTRLSVCVGGGGGSGGPDRYVDTLRRWEMRS